MSDDSLVDGTTLRRHGFVAHGTIVSWANAFNATWLKVNLDSAFIGAHRRNPNLMEVLHGLVESGYYTSEGWLRTRDVQIVGEQDNDLQMNDTVYSRKEELGIVRYYSAQKALRVCRGEADMRRAGVAGPTRLPLIDLIPEGNGLHKAASMPSLAATVKTRGAGAASDCSRESLGSSSQSLLRRMSSDLGSKLSLSSHSHKEVTSSSVPRRSSSGWVPSLASRGQHIKKSRFVYP